MSLGRTIVVLIDWLIYMWKYCFVCRKFVPFCLSFGVIPPCFCYLCFGFSFIIVIHVIERLLMSFEVLIYMRC